MVRLGVRLDQIPDLTTVELIDLAVLAEQRGYESVWIPGPDSLTCLAAIAVATRQIRLGTGILSVLSQRLPMLLAQSALGLDRLSGGRFIMGLGVGHPVSSKGHDDYSGERPFTRLRETVELVRRLLGESQVDYEGRVFRLKGAGLNFGPDSRPGAAHIPIYIAALGPQMVELAGEIADGVLLNYVTLNYLDSVLEHLDRGARRSGRSLKDIDVASYIRVAVTRDADDMEIARGAARRLIAHYMGHPTYVNACVQMGFGKEAATVAEAMARVGEDGAAAAVTDRMQEALAIVGPADYCRKEVEARRALGINLPIIGPFMVGAAEPSYRNTIGAFWA